MVSYSCSTKVVYVVQHAVTMLLLLLLLAVLVRSSVLPTYLAALGVASEEGAWVLPA